MDSTAATLERLLAEDNNRLRLALDRIKARARAGQEKDADMAAICKLAGDALSGGPEA